jgi:hypothetical protein
MRPIRRQWAPALLASAILVATQLGCDEPPPPPMRIDAVLPLRGATGQTFTIVGSGFGATQGSRTPQANRCTGNRLEVVRWSDEAITVRIPEDMPYWGIHKVLVYEDETFVTSSNSVDFWVTAASVPEFVVDRWEIQVRSFAGRYGKDDEWVDWMLDNRRLWEGTFRKAHEAPCTLTLAYRYEVAPVAYDPPWASEEEHMAAFARMAEAFFPSFEFRLLFGADPAETYGQVIVIPENASHAGTDTAWIYYEGIFGHEWGHVMGLAHHYATEDDHGEMMNMPPGDTRCTMDRTPPGYCSGGRTALGIPLDLDTTAVEAAAVAAIHDRYPPGH